MSTIDISNNKPLRVRVAYAINIHMVNIMIMKGDIGEEVEKQFFVHHCQVECPNETELTDDGTKRRMYMLCRPLILERAITERGDTLTLK